MFYSKTYKNLHLQYSYESEELKFIPLNAHKNKNRHKDNLLLNEGSASRIASYIFENYSVLKQRNEDIDSYLHKGTSNLA